MYGLALIDILVIVVYFLVVLAIGFWAMRRIHSQEDYFLAGRRFGKLVQTFAAFGQATASDDAVMVTSTTATHGAAGVWSALQMLFATPVYWKTIPWYRRMRLLSLGDFFEDRFGSKRMGAVYAVISIVCTMIVLSIAFNAMGKTIMALTPKSVAELSETERSEYQRALEWDSLEASDYGDLDAAERSRLQELRREKPSKLFSHIDLKIVLFGTCFIVVIYGVAGGLEAAFLTDMLQGFFVILLSVLLLPFVFVEINQTFGSTGVLGPFRVMHEKLPESFFEVFGSSANVEFTWYYIAALCTLVVFTVQAGAQQLTASGSAKTEYAARLGFTVGLYMKRLCTVLWGLLGLAAVVLYGGSVHDPDLLWGHTVNNLLGPLGVGLLGLMIACMLAALMSTADCFMITCSGLLTRNIYRPIMPGKTDIHYVRVGRVLAAGVVFGGAAMALNVETMFEQLKYLWELGPVFAAPFWLGVLWRRANARSTWGAIVFTLMLFVILPVLLPVVVPQLKTHPGLLKTSEAGIVVRDYVAHEMDVTNRQRQIAEWDELDVRGEASGPRPKPLQTGQAFTQQYKMPAESLFWRKGIKRNDQGQLQGEGMLNLDLVCYSALGLDLTGGPFAASETLRIVNRIVLPFAILVILSYITRGDDPKRLDRFYVKMKTPVQLDREADERELKISYENPRRFDHLKLLPGTTWEGCKWTREDTVGFSVAVLVALGIIGLLVLLTRLGA